MQNVAEPIELVELTSEIIFLKKEIDFLMKLLRNGYSSSVTIEKIRLLDRYWKGFEDNISRLDSLLTLINKEEKTLLNIDGINKEFYTVDQGVKSLKDSFYEYMSGCCACSKKNH
jgi:hypothetical protein